MSGQLSQIRRRMSGIQSTQKITRVMKMISVSKLQQVSQQIRQSQPFIDAVLTTPWIAQKSDKPQATICFAPDLGLASGYLTPLLNMLQDRSDSAVIWIGRQKIAHVRALVPILNEPQSTETLSMDDLMTWIDGWQKDYQLMVAQPQRDGLSVRFTRASLSVSVLEDDFRLDEPDPHQVRVQAARMVVYAILQQAWQQSRKQEAMIRQLAMDQADDHAHTMLEDLTHVYHRLRQEQITQELAELSSTLEVS